MQRGVRKAVVLRAEVAADASRDVMACVVGVPTAGRRSIFSRPGDAPFYYGLPRLPTPLVPFSSIAISSFSRSISPLVGLFWQRAIYFVEAIFTGSQF